MSYMPRVGSEKQIIIGPAQGCIDTILSSEDLSEYIANICQKHGYNVGSEEIMSMDGTRPNPRNLEMGVSIPGIPRDRRAIRKEIASEIGRIPVYFEPVSRKSVIDQYQTRLM
jgi:hypothetical protein